MRVAGAGEAARRRAEGWAEGWVEAGGDKWVEAWVDNAPEVCPADTWGPAE